MTKRLWCGKCYKVTDHTILPGSAESLPSWEHDGVVPLKYTAHCDVCGTGGSYIGKV